MKEKYRSLLFKAFALIFIFFTSTTTIFNKAMALTIEKESSSIIKKVSKDYTKKFCNSIAFGLSKDSAMNFSIEENKKVFERRKEFKNINKEILAEEIAISVIENCGYPINLIGEKGIQEFKSFYLLKDNEF